MWINPEQGSSPASIHPFWYFHSHLHLQPRLRRNPSYSRWMYRFPTFQRSFSEWEDSSGKCQQVHSYDLENRRGIRSSGCECELDSLGHTIAGFYLIQTKFQYSHSIYRKPFELDSRKLRYLCWRRTWLLPLLDEVDEMSLDFWYVIVTSIIS